MGGQQYDGYDPKPQGSSYKDAVVGRPKKGGENRGAWNVRTPYSVGKTAQLVAEVKNYGVEILGVSEFRWSGFGRVETQTGEAINLSGRDYDIHQVEWQSSRQEKCSLCEVLDASKRLHHRGQVSLQIHQDIGNSGLRTDQRC